MVDMRFDIVNIHNIYIKNELYLRKSIYKFSYIGNPNILFLTCNMI